MYTQMNLAMASNAEMPKNFEDDKRLKNLIDKPKTIKSSCSLRTGINSLPSIDVRNNRKRIARPCRKASEAETEAEESRWLKPGLSLPKMGDRFKCTKPPPSRMPSLQETSFVLSDTKESVTVSGTTLGGCSFSNIIAEELTEKFVGPTQCLSSFEVDISDMCDHKIEIDTTPIEESRALRNWEKWMKVRRRQNDFFSEKLKRNKCRLVMNTVEDLRQINEEKDILTFANITPPDKWRGDPNFWKERPKLSQRGLPDSYYAYQTLMERHILPPMEFVSVPDVIKLEKDVYCDEVLNPTNWEKLEYRKEQTKRLAKQLKKIAPHKVNAKGLVIIGERISPDEEDEEPVELDLPVIQISPPDFLPCTVQESVISLVINDTVLKYIDDLQEGPENHTWSLLFEQAPVGTITEKSLRIANEGTVAVKYSWISHREESKLSDLPRKSSFSDSCFFFDKNMGIIIPGQTLEIIFYHYSCIPGYHTETWRLKLEPDFFGIGIIRLTAVAESKSTLEDYFKIDAYLDSCLKATIVKEIADEIFDRAREELPKNIEYQSFFMEEELFEFQNPAHFYRYDVVEELKSLFYQVPLNPPQEWDLNLFTLESNIRMYAMGKARRSMLCRVMDLTRDLLRPGLECYKINKKIKMLYNCLCSIIGVMEANAERIRDNFSKIESLGTDQAEPVRSFSIKPESSQPSEYIYPENSEEISLTDKRIIEPDAFAISLEDLPHYRYALYVMFYSCLCEAVEQVAGIIESCRLFEHHGEVVTFENTYFLYDGQH